MTCQPGLPGSYSSLAGARVGPKEEGKVGIRAGWPGGGRVSRPGRRLGCRTVLAEIGATAPSAMQIEEGNLKHLPRRLTWFALLGVFAMVVAACGDEGEETTTTAPRAP